MKNKFWLFSSIFELIIGLLAVASCIVLMTSGENTLKYLVSLVLCVVFTISSVVGIIVYKKI